MRKRFCLPFTFCLLLILLIMMSACGKQEQPAKTTGTEPIKVTIAGGEPSGIYYMLLNGMTECVNKVYPGSVVTTLPGTSITNIIRTNNGEVDLSLCHSTNVVSALEGTEPFKEKLSNIASVAAFHPAHFQIVVNKKLGVNSLDEIITRKMKIRLSVDQAGSNAELSFRRLLNEYGVTYEDIKGWGGEIVFRNKADSSNMLADGSIDGFSTLALYPSPQIQEAAINKELVMLSFDPEVVGRLCQKYGYEKDVIPVNAYKFSDREITTFIIRTALIIRKDVPDDIAYKFTRSLNENLDYLKSVHVALEELTNEKLLRKPGAPLHPGAEKYYREAGIIR